MPQRYCLRVRFSVSYFLGMRWMEAYQGHWLLQAGMPLGTNRISVPAPCSCLILTPPIGCHQRVSREHLLRSAPRASRRRGRISSSSTVDNHTYAGLLSSETVPCNQGIDHGGPSSVAPYSTAIGLCPRNHRNQKADRQRHLRVSHGQQIYFFSSSFLVTRMVRR